MVYINCVVDISSVRHIMDVLNDEDKFYEMRIMKNSQRGHKTIILYCEHENYGYFKKLINQYENNNLLENEGQRNNKRNS